MRKKLEEFIFQFTISGKDLNIPPILAYPTSGLKADKIYIVTIKEGEK